MMKRKIECEYNLDLKDFNNKVEFITKSLKEVEEIASNIKIGVEVCEINKNNNKFQGFIKKIFNIT